MSTKKKIKTGIITALVLALVIVMINVMQIPEVIRCERLTAKYGHIFEDPKLYRQHWFIGDDFELKVLEYSSQHAVVYYINNIGTLSEGGYEYKAGTEVEFRKNYNDEWVCINGVTRWSEMGTADGIVMPYWWHSILLG